MARLVSIRFCDKAFPVLCQPGELELTRNDFCIVRMPDNSEQTGYVQGFEFRCTHQADAEELPKIERMANSNEVREWHFLKRREAEALATCKGMAEKHRLEMKISAVHFDNRSHKVVFYFTAEKRVDFRELVKDLASQFHARIELWQIGVRDETRRLGGVSVCGRDLCCASWLQDFSPVSIKYAKAQDIQFSPAKLSGACGRLRCCLGFEQQQYVEMGKGVPAIGNRIKVAEHGEVKVIDRNLLTESFTVLDGDGQTHLVRFCDVEGLEERFARPEEEEEVREERPDVDARASAALEDNRPRAQRPRSARSDGTDGEKKERDGEKKDEQGDNAKKGRRGRRSRSRRARDKSKDGEQTSRSDPPKSNDQGGSGDQSEDKKGTSRRRRRGGRRRSRRSGEGEPKNQGGDPQKKQGGSERRSERKESTPHTGGDATVIKPDAKGDGKSGSRRRGRGRRRGGRRTSSGDKPQQNSSSD